MRTDEEVQSTSKKQLACHTHIEGLCLDEQVNATAQGSTSSGRGAAVPLVDLIRRRRLGMAGRALLVAGSPATENRAAHAFGSKVPFCPTAVSEVYSSDVEKTEVLMENFRRAIGLRIKENKEVSKGDVPLCPMVGSEVYSSEAEKTEALMENFRRALGLRIKENKEV